MSTPTTPDEPAAQPEQQPEQQPDQQAGQQAGQQPTAHPAPGPQGQPQPWTAGPPPPGFAPPGYPGYPPQYPFAPTVREPWLNPAKRRTAGLIAAVVAIVLLGAGFVAGAAVTDHGGRSQHSRLNVGPVDQQGRGLQRDLPRRGGFQGPLPRGPRAPVTPTPTPTTSHS